MIHKWIIAASSEEERTKYYSLSERDRAIINNAYRFGSILYPDSIDDILREYKSKASLFRLASGECQ